MTKRYRLGFDIGGTFTDFVLTDAVTGATYLNKCLTTPEEPARAVMMGMPSLLEKAGIAGGDLEIVIHATTLITNALIERKGAKTALLTTHGFRDVLEMGTEVRYDVYDLFMEKPTVIAPRKLRYEVEERMDRDGNVLTPLNVGQLRAIASQMKADRVEALGIVFLHGFRNPAHEQQAAAILHELLPEVSISLGSVVAPEIREFERMTTTTANAYVQPITRKYVDELQVRLSETGYQRKLFLMASSGGIAAASTARELPIRLLESGPTAGVLAAIYYARQMGIGSLVTFDMGGTTAKIGLVKDFKASKSNVFEVGRVSRFKKGSGIPIRIPMVELIEIGAGGGSIANIDQLGLLKVGPHSASSVPGPACYGRGGTNPTVTDANLVLGYYDPDHFLGGAMKLDLAAAEDAIAVKVGNPLNMSKIESAHGIFEVVTQNMISATKVHIAERSEDPRKFYLFAFGGAGPAHAYEIARGLQMQGVIIPPGAGAASATGLVTAPVSFDYARSYVGQLNRVDAIQLGALFSDMAAEGLQVLGQAGIASDDPGVTVTHYMDLRHKGQGHEVTVEIPASVLEVGSFGGMAEEFYAAHTEKFGHAHRHLPVELITCRTSVAAPAPGVPLKRSALVEGDDGTSARKGERPAYFQEAGGMVMTPVYNRYLLNPGATFRGPAIIEERESTAICGPSGSVRIDEFGAVFIDIAAAEVSKALETTMMEV